MESQTEVAAQVPVPSPQVMKETLVKKFSGAGKRENIILVVVALVVVLAGIGTGYFLSGRKGFTASGVVPGAKNTQKEAGLADEKTFKDSAEGILKAGGIAGEGTHHLERDGGPSQNVYLTSTVIDLESFVEKKVKVWGQTISARKAGWLMDVGKVKVLD